MELYEIMFIIRPDLEVEEREEVIKGLSSTIEKNDGKVETLLDWHKRRLAYEINKHREGYYYLLYFKGSGTIIPEVEHYFRVNESVIRYLTVCSNEQELQLAAEKAAKDAEEISETAEVDGASKEENALEKPTDVEDEPAESGEAETTAATSDQQAEEVESKAPAGEPEDQEENGVEQDSGDSAEVEK